MILVYSMKFVFFKLQGTHYLYYFYIKKTTNGLNKIMLTEFLGWSVLTFSFFFFFRFNDQWPQEYVCVCLCVWEREREVGVLCDNLMSLVSRTLPHMARTHTHTRVVGWASPTTSDWLLSTSTCPGANPMK